MIENILMVLLIVVVTFALVHSLVWVSHYNSYEPVDLFSLELELKALEEAKMQREKKRSMRP